MKVLLFPHEFSDQRERVVSNRAIARIGCGPAALHQLWLHLMLLRGDFEVA
jgi:hypothetical protein